MGSGGSSGRQNGPPKHEAKTLPGGKSSGSKAPGGDTAGGQLTKEQAKAKCKASGPSRPNKGWCAEYCEKIEKAGPEKAPKWITEYKLDPELKRTIKACKTDKKLCERKLLWWKCYLEIAGKDNRFGENGPDQGNTGLIIAGAVGVIVLLAAAIGAYLFCCKGAKGKGTRGTASGKKGSKSIKSSKKSSKSRGSKAGSSKRSGKSKKSKKSGKSKKSKK